MQRIVWMFMIIILDTGLAHSQADTSFIYNPGMPYGTLDLRLGRSPLNFFFLEENQTFSFRTRDGKKNNSFLDMTAWDSEQYGQGNLREKLNGRDLFVMNYRLLLPLNYDTNLDEGYPIVIFFHGLHESGNCAESKCHHANKDYDPNVNLPPAPADASHRLFNNDYNLIHGGLDYLEARNRAGGKIASDPTLDPRGFPGFVLFPQSNNEWTAPEVENALRILRLIIKKYNINQNKVYVNGLSKGGYAAFEAIKRAPWLFAAAALFSPINDAGLHANRLTPLVRHMPIWIFQGEKDKAPLPLATQERVNNFRQAGMSVRYTTYNHLGHATWNEALAEPDFFTWLLGRSLNSVYPAGGTAAICETGSQGLTLLAPPGYPEYEWQLNNQTIKSGGENTLVVKMPGTYRTRFRKAGSEGWNRWSPPLAVGKNNPLPVKASPQTTLHLPDLNGNNTAILRAPAGFTQYQWFHNSRLLQQETTNTNSGSLLSIPASRSNGSITVRAAGSDNCFTAPSPGLSVFYNNSSPLNVAAPSDVAALSNTPSTVTVSWKDNATNESGFEVWRRYTTSGNTNAWSFAGTMSANTGSFKDTGLDPSARIEYKVRAVSESGRSEYAPSGSPLYVVTPPDTQPPAAPANVKAYLAAVNTISVSWEPSDDNSAIREYLVSIDDEITPTGNTDTTLLLNDLLINRTYKISVAAADVGGNKSDFGSPVEVSTKMEGLFYQHTTGAWETLTSVDWDQYEYSGKVKWFDLSPRVQEDFFNFRFDGFLLIKKAGIYQFRISSNDGSRLSLNDSLLVENDGIHGITTVTGPIQLLSQGPQRITVDFFDYMDIDSLTVEYKGQDTNREWLLMDQKVLRSTEDTGEPGEKLQLSVFPNPSSDGNINLAIQGIKDEPFTISIYNTLGERVNDNVISQAADSSMPFHIAPGLRQGIYILSVTQGDRTASTRLIVLK